MAGRYYKKTDIENKIFYKIPQWIHKNYERDFSDIPSKEFIIQEGDRLDIIAEQLYGDPTYWKALMIFNSDIVSDFFEDLTPGTVIRLPLEISKVISRI